MGQIKVTEGIERDPLLLSRPALHLQQDRFLIAPPPDPESHVAVR